MANPTSNYVNSYWRSPFWDWPNYGPNVRYTYPDGGDGGYRAINVSRLGIGFFAILGNATGRSGAFVKEDSTQLDTGPSRLKAWRCGPSKVMNLGASPYCKSRKSNFVGRLRGGGNIQKESGRRRINASPTTPQKDIDE